MSEHVEVVELSAKELRGQDDWIAWITEVNTFGVDEYDTPQVTSPAR